MEGRLGEGEGAQEQACIIGGKPSLDVVAPVTALR